MSKLERSIGIQYGDLAAELANIVSYQLRAQHGQNMRVIDIGSGSLTDVEQGTVTYETDYEYVYDNEELTGVKLTCEDNEFLKNGVVVTATSQMVSLYKEIMFATYLIGECRKSSMLSDEAMAYNDNWKDAI